MPSPNLEETIRRSLAFASERQHEFITLEHLLLALTEDQEAVSVLRACGVDLDTLREDLSSYLDHDLSYLVSESRADPRPTESFNRVLQRAVIHVQSSGREEVTGANVLVAIFSERESHALYYLQKQDMTRFDAVNYVSHGIAKESGLAPAFGKLSPNLEATIQRARSLARERRQGSLTLEHLLLALLEDPEVLPVLLACGIDLARLREHLLNYVNKHLDYLSVSDELNPRPTAACDRVVAVSGVDAKNACEAEISGLQMLLAMFSERESVAVYLLREQNVNRSEVVTAIGAARGEGGK